MKYAVLYCRGPRAAILDEAILILKSGAVGAPLPTSPDGVRDAQNCSPADKNFSVYVPEGETHVDGRFIFPVLRIGDLEPFKVKDDEGERILQVFDPKPAKMNSGVTYYKGRIPMDDAIIKVHFYDTAEPALHVWPKPMATVASTVLQSRELMAERAAQATVVLSKFAGWRFGEPEFIGDFHYATNDPAIMANFPPDFKPAADSGYWRDHTPGPDSIETKNEKKGQAVLDFQRTSNELRAGQKSLDLRIVELRHQLEGLVSISEMVAVSIANIAAAEAEQIERAARGMADRMDAEVMSS